MFLRGASCRQLFKNVLQTRKAERDDAALRSAEVVWAAEEAAAMAIEDRRGCCMRFVPASRSPRTPTHPLTHTPSSLFPTLSVLCIKAGAVRPPSVMRVSGCAC